MPNCEMLFTKRISNLVLKGTSAEMGFEPRLETFYRSTLTDSKRNIVPDPGSCGSKGAITECKGKLFAHIHKQGNLLKEICDGQLAMQTRAQENEASRR